MSVDYRETLVVYLNSETTVSAAQSLSLSVATLKSRLNTMKKAGVKIPRKPSKVALTQLEVAQLNSIINKHLKEK